MYYPFFLTYILTGVIIALVVFIWALKNGQFSDQQEPVFWLLRMKKLRLLIVRAKENTSWF